MIISLGEAKAHCCLVVVNECLMTLHKQSMAFVFVQKHAACGLTISCQRFHMIQQRILSADNIDPYPRIVSLLEMMKD